MDVRRFMLVVLLWLGIGGLSCCNFRAPTVCLDTLKLYTYMYVFIYIYMHVNAYIERAGGWMDPPYARIHLQCVCVCACDVFLGEGKQKML